MNFDQLVESVKKPKVPKYFLPDKEGNVNCSNIHLTSLQGAPQKVGGMFNCGGNDLTSLEGLPKFIGGNLLLSSNPNLPLLELARVDAANKVKGSIFFPFLDAPVDKAKCTREYYDAVKHTGAEEQQDIANI